MNYDIYVRAHIVVLERKKTKSHIDKKANPHQVNEPKKWPDHALIFDCETRLTTDQSLTFGFWRFCELRNGNYVPLEEGIFHADELGARELIVLGDFAKMKEASTAKDGAENICLYSRSKFVFEVLGIAIQAKALIVGFNLPFDLSRLAEDWRTAKKGGWSLILTQWRDRKTQILEPTKYFPRIVIKAINSKTALISSTRAPLAEPKEKGRKAKLWPPARFLDLRTLLWALRNKSFSLKTACKEFKIPCEFKDHKPSGLVNLAEVKYCREDVKATVLLLNEVKKEYDLHPVDVLPDKMFSPASVAKSYLEKLNVYHPQTKIKNS